MYKFDEDLYLWNIQAEDRLATYVAGERTKTQRADGAVCLVRSSNGFVVASFNKFLYCNNASELPYEKAWDLLIEIRREFAAGLHK